MIDRVGEYLEVPCHELAEEFDPVRQVPAAVNDGLVPGFCLLFDSLAVAQPAHVREVREGIGSI